MSKREEDRLLKLRGFKAVASFCMVLGLISFCCGGAPAWGAIHDWLDPGFKMLNPTAEQMFQEGMKIVPVALVAIATGAIAYMLADRVYGDN